MSEQTKCEICNGEEIIWMGETFDSYTGEFVPEFDYCPKCVKESESSE